MEYMTASDAYRVLNLFSGAHDEEVVRAYRIQAEIWHPGRDASSVLKIPRFRLIHHALARLLVYQADFFPSTPLENMLAAYDTLRPTGHLPFIDSRQDLGPSLIDPSREREANKRAAELIAEEEKSKLKEEQLKRKAERKRAKKKRRNERKKQQQNSTDCSRKSEKGSGEAAAPESSCSNDSGSDDPDEPEQLELDPMSAFVSKIALHKNIVLPRASARAAGEAHIVDDTSMIDVSDKEYYLPHVVERQQPHGLLSTTVGGAAGQHCLSQGSCAEMEQSACMADANFGSTVLSTAAYAAAAADARSAPTTTVESCSTLTALPSFSDPVVTSSNMQGSVVSLPDAVASVVASSPASSYNLPSSAVEPSGSSFSLSAAASVFVPSDFKTVRSSVLSLDTHGLDGSGTADPADPIEEAARMQAKESWCLELGRLGNAHALDGEFIEAIVCYSEGICIDPCDYRFLGNRSLCYERLMQFEEALSDADAAITVCESYIKGHFRRGMALAGLKRNSEAEQAFEQALALDPSDGDTQQELAAVRTAQLVEMGFADFEAQQALSSHNGSLRRALEALLARGRPHAGAAGRGAADEVSGILSDVNGQWIESRTTQKADHQILIDSAASSTPVGSLRPGNGGSTGSAATLTGLWIGNIYEPISEKKLLELFSRYGAVASVHLLPERHCGFVNFYHRSAAVKAMEGLQHHIVGGNRLLIRFPDKI